MDECCSVFVDSRGTLCCSLPVTICSNPFVPFKNTEQRKLAAILPQVGTDMVGYNAPSRRNEVFLV